MDQRAMKPPCTCTHADAGHCPGGVKHAFYKQTERKNPDAHICTTRHCLSPLCSCTDYTPETTDGPTTQP